jgi:hypothetical protein
MSQDVHYAERGEAGTTFFLHHSRICSINKPFGYYVTNKQASGISFRPGIRERLAHHLIVTSLIDADTIPAKAVYLICIGRTIAVILVNPLLMASQHFSFADFVISPEFLAAGRTTQQEHIKSLPCCFEMIPSSYRREYGIMIGLDAGMSSACHSICQMLFSGYR